MTTYRNADQGPVGVDAVAGWVVVTVRGEVDLAMEPALVAAQDEVATRDEPHLYVDLTGVDFLDSSGVAALAGLQRHAQQRRGHFVLSAAAPMVQRVLDLTGLAAAADDPGLAPDAVRHPPQAP